MKGFPLKAVVVILASYDAELGFGFGAQVFLSDTSPVVGSTFNPITD